MSKTQAPWTHRPNRKVDMSKNMARHSERFDVSKMFELWCYDSCSFCNPVMKDMTVLGGFLLMLLDCFEMLENLRHSAVLCRENIPCCV